jgi:hypothetical protein
MALSWDARGARGVRGRAIVNAMMVAKKRDDRCYVFHMVLCSSLLLSVASYFFALVSSLAKKNYYALFGALMGI